MKILLICSLLSAAAALPYQSNFLNGFGRSRYTSLDLAKVDFDNTGGSEHKQFITVMDDDFSAEVYKLIGVAPASAVSGGAATTYSANIGGTVPIYEELDENSGMLYRYLVHRMRQATPYSAKGGGQPLTVIAETTLTGNRFAVLLDD